MSTWKTTSEHFYKMLYAAPTKSSRVQMIFCSVATTLPLVFGLLFNQIPFAIYGSITGYFMTVNDQVGSLYHRLLTTTISLAMLMSGFYIGLLLKSSPFEQMLVIAVMAFWVGLMGGQGAELERAALFSTFEIIMAAHSPLVTLEAMPPIIGYSLIGYVFIILATFSYLLLWRPPTILYPRLRESIRKPLESTPVLHMHALSYALAALLSAWFIEHFQIERGYWTIITVLLILKPDRIESFYRIIQRLIGTCGGVLVAAALVFFIHNSEIAIALISVCAFFVPWAIKKNYWLVSFLISVIVVLLLELPVIEHGNFHIPFLRIYATAYGGILSVIGIILSKTFSLFLKPGDQG